ncbi:MAG TPA: hypothetical protein VGS19_09930 [Streptosporangiaceae bacterium]|nr:hypothetical protein [Streptosporangiaceae bacterium]
MVFVWAAGLVGALRRAGAGHGGTKSVPGSAVGTGRSGYAAFMAAEQAGTGLSA